MRAFFSPSCSPRPQSPPRPSRPRSTVAEMTNKQAVVNTTAGHVRHRSAAGSRAEPRRLLHQAGARGGLQGHDLPPRDQAGDHPGRRSVVEGSGEGEAVWHRRARRVEGRDQQRAGDARRGVGGAAAGQARQRRRAVLRLRHRSAGADRQVHRLRPGLGRHGRRAEDLRDARDGRRPRDRADRDCLGRDSRHAAARAGAVQHRDASTRCAPTAPCSTPPPGPITIEFFPDKAPEHVRAFLRLAGAGVFDGTSFHRVVQGLRRSDRLPATRAGR